MKAEEFFEKKFGNKITASESWVIRLMEEYAESRLHHSVTSEDIETELKKAINVYKTMCKPDVNFEKYYSKGWLECATFIKRISNQPPNIFENNNHLGKEDICICSDEELCGKCMEDKGWIMTDGIISKQRNF